MMNKTEIKANGICISCGICDFSKRVECVFEERKIETKIVESHQVEQALSSGSYEDIVGKGNYFVGHLKDEQRRLLSGSGGFISWIADKLVSESLVDELIFVGVEDDEYKYVVGKTITKQALKSKYYPVNLKSVLESLSPNKKYAFIGLPCHCEMLDGLKSEGIAENIRYKISLFCGHLKKKEYSDYIKMSMGQRDGLVEFRTKLKGKKASEYGSSVLKGTEVVESIPNKNLRGVNWAIGYFMERGCDYCNDVSGKYADVSAGDAWLEPYVSDYNGDNVIIVRNKAIRQILTKYQSEHNFKATDAETIYRSQEGGYRNKSIGFIQRVIMNKSFRINRKVESFSYRIFVRQHAKKIDQIFNYMPTKLGKLVFDFLTILVTRIYVIAKKLDEK